jgi:hypothetical protein
MSGYSAIQADLREMVHQGVREPYLLYAMGLRLRTLDYDALETDCLVDGRDDKKIDFVNIDLESGTATIAQSYFAKNWNRGEASSNKAADLGIALNWLLESALTDIPRTAIRAAARELREGLDSGEISKIDVFYVHNLKSSKNVELELTTVKRAAERLLLKYSRDGQVVPECLVREVSRDVVEDWRRSQHEAISVQDVIKLRSLTEPQVYQTAEWHAVVMIVPVEELIRLREKYGDELSSANVRDYLGSRQQTRNINRQIEQTVKNEPDNFLVFNNGITLLTHGIDSDDVGATLQGVAIINGAQTTGSLAQAATDKSAHLDSAAVLVRVIKCNNPNLIERVIRYNNTQNPIKAWELRVVDSIQKRLVSEFSDIGITYQVRRSQSRRRHSDVHYERLGPYLAAFYGDPSAAHRNKADLFESEKKYRNLFDDDTHVRNLLFVYQLGNSVQTVKSAFKEKIDSGSASDDDSAIYDYFRYGAFSLVLLHLTATVIGLWLEGKERRYRRRVTLIDDVLLDAERADSILVKLVEAVVRPVRQYFVNTEEDPYNIIRTQAGIDALSTHVKVMIAAVEQMQPDNYESIKSNLVLVK